MRVDEINSVVVRVLATKPEKLSSTLGTPQSCPVTITCVPTHCAYAYARTTQINAI